MSCALLFMMWLGKFDVNNTLHQGEYGWFIETKDEPLGGWFTANMSLKDKNSSILKANQTNYLVISKKRYENEDFDTLIRKKCKLDNKVYYYYEGTD